MTAAIVLTSLVNVQLKNFGYATPKASQIAKLANQDTAMYVNFSDSSYSTQDVACHIICKEVGNSSTFIKKFIGYFVGESLPTPFKMTVIIEAGATPVAAVEKLKADLISIITSKIGCDVELLVTAAATMPAVAGLNGAVADANIPAVGLIVSASGNRAYAGV